MMRLDIVYEDNHIIICNKPAGVASQSDRSFDEDLLSSILNYNKNQTGKAEAYIINRLDKPVSGLVLFARDKKTAASLSALSGEHSIEKNYYAVVKGQLEGTGEFTDYLIKENKGNISRTAKEGETGAKKASLGYEALECREIEGIVYTLVKIHLYTGRHHQIRVQFSSRGHGLYGDMKYNKDFKDRRGVTPALCAYRLSFNNPYGVDRITVEITPSGNIWDFEYFK